VHGDGKLPPIPLLMRSSLADSAGAAADGQLRFEAVPDGSAVARSIQIRYGAPYRSFVALHEIGHFLDLHGLPGIGFASADLEVAALDDWRTVVAQSRAVELLTVLIRSRDAKTRQRARRLLTPEELWARSDAQFVALRSGDEALLTSVYALRHQGSGGADKIGSAVYFPRQWDDDDFDRIGNAIEELFRRLEWIA
jgi:hypothetical protein